MFWVFHGCPTSEGTRSICTSGFKIGGQDGHPISIGAAHGQGVYTATGPSTPMGYGSKSRSVILCNALVGSEGDCKKGDHWRPMPNGDWMIFRICSSHSVTALSPLTAKNFKLARINQSINQSAGACVPPRTEDGRDRGG